MVFDGNELFTRNDHGYCSIFVFGARCSPNCYEWGLVQGPFETSRFDGRKASLPRWHFLRVHVQADRSPLFVAMRHYRTDINIEEVTQSLPTPHGWLPPANPATWPFSNHRAVKQKNMHVCSTIEDSISLERF